MRFSRAIVTLALLLVIAQPIYAAGINPSSDPLEARMTEISAAFSSSPNNIKNLFSPVFLKSVPPSQLEAILRDMHNKYGPVISAKLLNHPSPERGTYLITFQKGYEAKLDLGIDSHPPYQIDGLWIGTVSPVAGDLASLVTEIKKLPGMVSFSVCRLDDKGLYPIVSLNPDTPLALGSSFKLFVLGALIEDIESGRHSWTEPLALNPVLKSLPSGILQNWPVGSPLTLHSLASLMVSVSDNTAADHLLMALGRERVEGILGKMGVSRPDLNIPFPTTREMFLLKGRDNGNMVPLYLAKDVAGRREFLRDVVSHQSLSEVKEFGSKGPLAIDRLEWFASSQDMVRAMDWIRCHTVSEDTKSAREILAINPGIDFDNNTWSYIGFKGGAEPGVLSMTFLLQSRKGKWYSMAACWSNPQAEVEADRLTALMEKAGSLLTTSDN